MTIDCPPAFEHQIKPGEKFFCVYRGERGGWCAHIEGHAYPFGGWRMDRCWPFKWMAELEFPIERLSKDGPRR